jgi:hypothetical protein
MGHSKGLWGYLKVLHHYIASAMIYTGYQSKIVYDFCKPLEVNRVFAIKGVAGVNRPVVSRPNRGNSAKVALFSLGVDSAKELIYSRLKIEDSGAGYCHFPIGQGYDEEYFRATDSRESGDSGAQRCEVTGVAEDTRTKRGTGCAGVRAGSVREPQCKS